MSSAPGCPRCASARPPRAPSSTRSTRSCTTPRPTSSSPRRWTASSTASPTGSTSSASTNSSASCGSSSANSSSAATTTRSRSATRSPPPQAPTARPTNCVGAVISPLLANMFLHYAFDAWMAREFPAVQFERYCDDIIVHARSERHARLLCAAIAKRLAECGLELNEQKTRIVYCKDDKRPGSYEHTSFDFLGYTFRPREV